ncbi:hypothetical protein EGW08_015620 [Elysia chlorotica]|uniref:Uncharacterized protein n=1 Tax=Elysia chlorotica TaxID=188477 RepID=A0A3S1B755_ELYCH|nr:hypothetical protein EGW08_015620 [Elysia chlorotica]
MAQERLSFFIILSIEANKLRKLDFNYTIDVFAERKPWRKPLYRPASMKMSERGQNSSQWKTSEAKSLFFLLRDEYEKIKQMPIWKSYKEMERIIDIFTSEDVLHKLFLLTKEDDREEFMLAMVSVETDSNQEESERRYSCAKLLSEDRQNLIKRNSSSWSISPSLRQVQSPNLNHIEFNSGRRCSDLNVNRRQRQGILQNLIKNDEIPEFRIPPQLCQRKLNRRHTDACAASSIDRSREAAVAQKRSLSLTTGWGGCLRDSAALPGFFTNTGLSLESLNIRTLCDHVRESTGADCNIILNRRLSAASICQEKHLQDLDLNSLHSFQSADEGIVIRLFVFEQILTLRENYVKLRGKNVLMRFIVFAVKKHLT